MVSGGLHRRLGAWRFVAGGGLPGEPRSNSAGSPPRASRRGGAVLRSGAVFRPGAVLRRGGREGSTVSHRFPTSAAVRDDADL